MQMRGGEAKNSFFSSSFPFFLSNANRRPREGNSQDVGDVFGFLQVNPGRCGLNVSDGNPGYTS